MQFTSPILTVVVWLSTSKAARKLRAQGARSAHGFGGAEVAELQPPRGEVGPLGVVRLRGEVRVVVADDRVRSRVLIQVVVPARRHMTTRYSSSAVDRRRQGVLGVAGSGPRAGAGLVEDPREPVVPRLAMGRRVI